MPTLWIKDRSSVPAEGWQYPAIMGPPVKASDYGQLYGKVKKHYEANGREVPTREEIDRYICENLTAPCYEQDRRTVFRNRFTDPPSYLSRGMNGPNWPLPLSLLKALAKPEDRGLGDVVARTVGPFGGDAWKAWFKSIFGKDCGCDRRQDTLNVEYPL